MGSTTRDKKMGERRRTPRTKRSKMSVFRLTIRVMMPWSARVLYHEKRETIRPMMTTTM